MTGNRFSTLFFNTCGTFGRDVYMAPNVVWSGNVWDNTNQVIPAPWSIPASGSFGARCNRRPPGCLS